MITVKQYAEERNITIQAVHQSMNGKRKKERLEGHIHIVDGVKWLDDEAVRILDEARNKSPIVWEKADTTERIEELERERDAMLIKIAAQADRISELAQWKAEQALLIAGAEQIRMQLQAAEGEKKILEGFIADAKAEIAALGDEKAQVETEARAARQELAEAQEAAQRAHDELAQARAEKDAWESYSRALAEWNAKPFWLRRKKDKPVAPAMEVGV